MARLASVACVFALSTGVASSISSVAHAAGVSDHLVAHWAFDETVAGSPANDSVGSNDGVPTNNPAPSTVVPPVTFDDARSASFDGSNYFTFARPISTDFTICAWVKTTSTGGGVNHWTSAPILDSETGGVAYDLGFGVGNGGKLMFGNGGLVGGNLVDRQVNGTTTINDDVWHNVCATRNNTNGEVDLYVDATLDGSGTTGTGALTSNPHARVGFGFDGAALFHGLIDDVRVYDVVLTTEQLTNLTDGSGDPDVPPKAPLAPVVTPADDATSVAVDSNLTLAFNRAPTAGTGDIEIHRADDDSTVATIAADDADQVSISGSTATVDAAADLDTSTAYYVLIDADAFKDSDGDFYAGISDPTAWSITTVNAAPVISGASLGHVTLNEDGGPLTVTVTATDDADTATLAWSVKTPPSFGTATLLAPGLGGSASFSYTPNPHWHGSESFVVEAADSAGASADLTVSVTVNAPVRPEGDGDGVDESVEAAGPNGGDANDDGVPDSSQPNVASFPNPGTGDYVSVAVSEDCTLSDVAMASESTTAGDHGFTYPAGLVDFTADCAAGASATATVYFVDPPDGNVLVRKFDPSVDAFRPVVDVLLTRTTIGGEPVAVARYILVDGGPLDGDHLVNGTIVDPVGLALAAPESPSGRPRVSAGTPPRASAAPGDGTGELPYTGSAAVPALTSVATIVTTAGVLMLLAARRRQDDRHRRGYRRRFVVVERSLLPSESEPDSACKIVLSPNSNSLPKS